MSGHEQAVWDPYGIFYLAQAKNPNPKPKKSQGKHISQNNTTQGWHTSSNGRQRVRKLKLVRKTSNRSQGLLYLECSIFQGSCQGCCNIACGTRTPEGAIARVLTLSNSLPMLLGYLRSTLPIVLHKVSFFLDCVPSLCMLILWLPCVWCLPVPVYYESFLCFWFCVFGFSFECVWFLDPFA